MKTVKTIEEMKKIIKSLKEEKKVIGFVPTMGYLHEGHLSLIRESVKKVDRTIVSIFVNPTQFGPGEDYDRYPRDIERDKRLLEKEKVDYLFHPSVEEMYPPGYKTYVEVIELQDKLCGRSRPGHFRGVCTIVLKLFNIIQPNIAFFGQKDAQQAIIIKRMVRDLNLDVEIKVMPIVREKDGLAMSSRNTYLSPEERKQATVLYRSLQLAKELIEKGEKSSELIISEMKKLIETEPSAKIDYVEIVDLEELNPIKEIKNEALIALAVYIGNTRLIDNIIVNGKL
ncbi:pantoate--beta-alanine ligase [Candidatus Aminicenantes bacterium AC-335-B20]|jgi:pantoate--beta-alanine ligase|nr:pantoate--beta-alanine ligase [SCandidatus Aminicenantes bacterium Aminicenantia_JdfR_composite]MCP2596272.1 pantoate--beta-alanine ligase [Candidatus Aminicenantes bacterium AC-335-G13]MCP2597847.1 pantoate--beta-alanine ligase [Candidatus Aminicenantes bacterium AC-335-L06]MCP2599059.1 pantoate--beta-alanine ligase [Candidatus Aminicenantes bacterium AC-335-B20]MCP2605615.1 pantoate--beta-alanine ligase [Candidatus Aminicenantes bacterium AC-335-O07]